MPSKSTLNYVEPRSAYHPNAIIIESPFTDDEARILHGFTIHRCSGHGECDRAGTFHAHVINGALKDMTCNSLEHMKR